MKEFPWWVRLALWFARARVVAVIPVPRAPPLLPPPPGPRSAEQLVPAPGQPVVMKTLLSAHLMNVDLVLNMAFTGSPWKLPDPRYRS